MEAGPGGEGRGAQSRGPVGRTPRLLCKFSKCPGHSRPACSGPSEQGQEPPPFPEGQARLGQCRDCRWQRLRLSPAAASTPPAFPQSSRCHLLTGWRPPSEKSHPRGVRTQGPLCAQSSPHSLSLIRSQPCPLPTVQGGKLRLRVGDRPAQGHQRVDGARTCLSQQRPGHRPEHRAICQAARRTLGCGERRPGQGTLRTLSSGHPFHLVELSVAPWGLVRHAAPTHTPGGAGQGPPCDSAACSKETATVSPSAPSGGWVTAEGRSVEI